MADFPLGNAAFKVTLNTRDFDAGLTAAENKVRASTDRMLSRIDNLGRGFQDFGKKASAGITAPLAAVATIGVRAQMQLEDFTASLEVLTGSASEAAGMVRSLEEYASATPFDDTSLRAATRSLIAFGTETENVIPTIQMLGEIAAGTETGIDDLAESYGRVALTGRLSTDRALQFARMGIPIFQELAESMGVSVDEVQKLISAGQVGLPQLQQVFQRLTTDGGRFAGMMEKMGETTTGQLNTLRASWDDVTLAVGDVFLPRFQAAIGVVQTGVDWFLDLDEAQQNNLITWGSIAAAVGPVAIGLGTIGRLIPGLVAGFRALGVAMAFLVTNPIGLIITGIGLAIAGLGALWVSEQRKAAAFTQEMRDQASALNDAALQARGYGDAVRYATDAEHAGAMSAINSQLRLQASELAKAEAEYQALYDSMGAVQQAAAGWGWGAAELDAAREKVIFLQQSVADLQERLQAQASLTPTESQELNRPDVPGLGAGGGAGGGSAPGGAAVAAARTAADVMDEVALAGKRADAEAHALGGTLEQQATALETRNRALARAVTELTEMQFAVVNGELVRVADHGEAIDNLVQRLTSNAEELQRVQREASNLTLMREGAAAQAEFERTEPARLIREAEEAREAEERAAAEARLRRHQHSLEALARMGREASTGQRAQREADAAHAEQLRQQELRDYSAHLDDLARLGRQATIEQRRARQEAFTAGYAPHVPRDGGADYGFRARELSAGVDLGLRGPAAALHELENNAAVLEERLRGLITAGQFGSDEFQELSRQLRDTENAARGARQALADSPDQQRLDDWQAWRGRQGDGGLSQVITADMESRNRLTEQTRRLHDVLAGGGRGGILRDDLTLGAGMGMVMTGPDGLTGGTLDAYAEQFGHGVTEAGHDFGQVVFDSAVQWTDALISSVQSGSVADAFAATIRGAQNIVGGMDLGSANFLGSAIPVAGILSAGIGILGSLVGGLFNRRQDVSATRASGAAPRSAPAVNFGITINESLSVQSLTDPASRGAIRRNREDMLQQLVDVIHRNVLPRLTALDGGAA